jgi:hypothetical protein
MKGGRPPGGKERSQTIFSITKVIPEGVEGTFQMTLNLSRVVWKAQVLRQEFDLTTSATWHCSLDPFFFKDSKLGTQGIPRCPSVDSFCSVERWTGFGEMPSSAGEEVL